MKRAFVIAAAVCLLCAGCGQKAAAFTEQDLTLSIAGTSYRCGAEMSGVIAQLGEDYEYAEANSCDHDGLDKTYIYPIAEFYTYPSDNKDIINEIYTQSAEASTSKGITIGAEKAAVLAAHGEDCEDTGFQLVYRVDSADAPAGKAALCFDITDGAVSAIYVTTQTQAI